MRDAERAAGDGGSRTGCDSDEEAAPPYGDSRAGVDSEGGSASASGDGAAVETDGGTVDAHSDVDYLEREINLFRPATPFMRDNLRMIFGLFAVWLAFVFGPVTASYFWPAFMTETQVLGGFPLNFFLTALVAPAAALGLAAFYAWYRDRLDEKYGISHDAATDEPEVAVADGGDE